MKRKAYLTLANGQVFSGVRFGAEGSAMGEVVFSTGMTGSLEMLTDRSAFGQIVLQTFPLAGASGVIPEDFESDAAQARAFIVKEASDTPSNFRSAGKLADFMKENGVVGLCDIDTRALAKVLRDEGSMNGLISSEPADAERLEEIKKYKLPNAVNAVSCKEVITHTPEKTRRRRIALWDFGVKNGLIAEFVARGCEVAQAPASYSAADIARLSPEGVVLSGGPGGPYDNAGIVDEIAKFVKASPCVPIFAVGLGHLMLALARGAAAVKLTHGHRGANYPVRDLKDGRVYITSQSHGYAVAEDQSAVAEDQSRVASDQSRVAAVRSGQDNSGDSTAAKKPYATRFVNVNDGTCEGLDYLDHPSFSVQFNPEGRAGPRDTVFLFDRFIDMIDAARATAARKSVRQEADSNA